MREYLPEDFNNIIRQFNFSKIPYLIIGSSAIVIYLCESIRKISDLDVVIKPNDFSKVKILIENSRFRFNHNKIYKKKVFTEFIHEKNLSKIHIVINNLKVCDINGKKIEFEYPLFNLIDKPKYLICNDIEYPLVPVEDLILMKLLPNLADQKIGTKHIDDILKLLTLDNLKIDYDVIKNKLLSMEPCILNRITQNKNTVNKCYPDYLYLFNNIL